MCYTPPLLEDLHCWVIHLGDGAENAETITDVLMLVQADSVFSGISTFGRLPYFPCLSSDRETFDIAFLG